MTENETDEEKPDGYSLEWNEDRKPDGKRGTPESGSDR